MLELWYNTSRHMEHIDYSKASEVLSKLFEGDEKVLMLVRGLPGSGKSTLAGNIIKNGNKNIEHYEADMFFIDANDKYIFNMELIGYAHRWCEGMTAFALNHGKSVIVANTFTCSREINPYIEIAKITKAKLVVVYMAHNWGNIHNVPEAAIERMKARFASDTSNTPDFIVDRTVV